MDTRPPRTKNLSVPDEILSLEKGSASTVRVGELVVGRLVLEPGWRWSEHVRPIAGTTSCQFHHVGLALSGAMDGRMDDGTEFEVRPGDVFDVPPGHDNWVIGDEPLTAVIWGGWRGWGKRPVGERILTTMLIHRRGTRLKLLEFNPNAWLLKTLTSLSTRPRRHSVHQQRLTCRRPAHPGVMTALLNGRRARHHRQVPHRILAGRDRAVHCRRAAIPAGDDRSQAGRAGRAAAPYRGSPHRTQARPAMPSQRAHEMLPVLVDHRRATARPVTGRKPRASALTDPLRPDTHA